MVIDYLVEKYSDGIYNEAGWYRGLFYGNCGELRVKLVELDNEMIELTLFFTSIDRMLYHKQLATGKFTTKEIENLLANLDNIYLPIKEFCEKSVREFSEEIRQYVTENNLSRNPANLKSFNLLVTEINIGRDSSYDELNKQIEAKYENFKVKLAEKVFQLIKGVE